MAKPGFLAGLSDSACMYFPSCYHFTSQTCIVFIAIIEGEAEISGQEVFQLLVQSPAEENNILEQHESNRNTMQTTYVI